MGEETDTRTGMARENVNPETQRILPRGGEAGRWDLHVDAGAFGTGQPPPDLHSAHVPHALPTNLDHVVAYADFAAGVRASAVHYRVHPRDRYLCPPRIKMQVGQGSQRSVIL